MEKRVNQRKLPEPDSDPEFNVDTFIQETPKKARRRRRFGAPSTPTVRSKRTHRGNTMSSSLSNTRQRKDIELSGISLTVSQRPNGAKKARLRIRSWSFSVCTTR
ncbi:hypothetical protein BC834DRAFT_862194 [Gloeopeniophorella convolvens]|nr:hypothetical protein BC834DRAFT_862194 [Gloeopeniophorella convolvens]